MPRKPRPNRRGDTHHVFVRGVAKSPLVRDALDYARTLDLLERTVSRYALTCHAWCLMPNHHHYLFTTREANVSRAMQWLGARTAESFNACFERLLCLWIPKGILCKIVALGSR